MIQMYTTPSCSSCRKAKKWFDEHRINYREKNIFNVKLTKDDIMLMLKNTEGGFEDIISTRSKVFQDQNMDLEELSLSELTDFIIDRLAVMIVIIIVMVMTIFDSLVVIDETDVLAEINHPQR